MRILQLRATNVKRLRAVEITPHGNLVVIGGGNGQGKSSVLDAIMYAIGGKDAVCSVPVRRGESHAEVTCDLGEFTVRRTFTADGGGQLTVETRDGARFRAPQARLDELFATLSFDPLAFARMSPREQAETLRALVGLNFSLLEQQCQAAFDARTDVNREGKALRARFDALPALHPDTPNDEIPSGELLAELDRVQAANRQNDAARARLTTLAQRVETAQIAAGGAEARCQATREEIAFLQQRLEKELQSAETARGTVATAQQEWRAQAATVNALVDADPAPVQERLRGLEDLNRRVRENAARARLEAELEAKRTESAALTERIEAIDAEKQQAISAARFPVEGLGFDAEGGVTFSGLPFDQASAAEQLRVSVAIGMALNPKLRVLLVRDASLLDEHSLELVSAMAAEHDYQLWIERVETDGATVVIEDGSVVGAPESPASDGNSPGGGRPDGTNPAQAPLSAVPGELPLGEGGAS